MNYSQMERKIPGGNKCSEHKQILVQGCHKSDTFQRLSRCIVLEDGACFASKSCNAF